MDGMGGGQARCAPTALKIQGRSGKHSLINDCYEPLQIKHNGKACWVARGVAPRYIFHTGKNRWVISKCLDDGYRCWTFISGAADDPTQEEGPWTCCDGPDQWNADANVTVQQVPCENDKFVQLRLQCDTEMRAMGLLDNSNLKSLWRKLDYNGNNIVSLAEIDKMVVELVAGKVWPEWLNNKPALMRAYKKTCLKDGDGDAWVEKKEFHALLLNIFWFNKLFKIFHDIAAASYEERSDRRIDVNEFIKGCGLLGLNLNPTEAREEFAKIDNNHGGQVLFVEFCAYIRTRVNPDSNPYFDADIISGTDAGVHAIRKHHGHKATHTHTFKKKSFRDFDELERKIKSIMYNKKKLLKLWHRIDFNGNKIVSLAEIDKLCVEAYPLLNHKPALMRAYKATIKAGDGDDWVQKREFKSLLGNLFYFNKIFWIFDHVDGDKDRRLTFEEFKWCLHACGAKVSDAEARQHFSKVDVNGGGIILFDEFCKFFTEQMCPECMEKLID